MDETSSGKGSSHSSREQSPAPRKHDHKSRKLFQPNQEAQKTHGQFTESGGKIILMVVVQCTYIYYLEMVMLRLMLIICYGNSLKWYFLHLFLASAPRWS